MDPPTLDALYRTPPDRFVAARTAAAEAARAAGDRDGARALAALRRPTVPAWLVNLLALADPAALAPLDALADALRTASRERDGARLRALADERRQVVGTLLRRVAALARAAGATRPGPAVLAEVESTLHAALADGEVAALVRAGRLTRPAAYSGFADAPRRGLHVVPPPPATRNTTGPRDEAPTAPATTAPATTPSAGTAPRDGTAPADPTPPADPATPAGRVAGDPVAYRAALDALVAARAAEEEAGEALAGIDEALAAQRREAERLQRARLAAVARRDAARRTRRAAQQTLAGLD
ncbi:hypothetical protein GCM10010124_24710 [Pilimelia terevasa]|uniref:Uncharacterized protein n=1 Tax=Pilimelia terevasa TaxID=53372 RepID=A0A8J3BRY2_9ACTN|nr:hypothetical protein GCM10010124_24710 [Pilimelia terevasa]